MYVLLLFTTALLESTAHTAYVNEVPYWDSVFLDEPKKMELITEGLGPIHWEVSTTNPDAQAWFDQCLALIFGFNHEDAIRSCEYAAELDPDLAMAKWGIAYAYGPNINLQFDVDRATAANDALFEALELLETTASNATAKEKDMIESLVVRYTNDTRYFPWGDESRLSFDRAYFEKMKAIQARYPEDVHIKTFTAESALDLRPWKAWEYNNMPTLQTRRSSTPGFPEILEAAKLLKEALVQEPDHRGALHYIIHAVEASSDPATALRAAKRIKSVCYKQAHLVHAASHIYARVGDWGAAIISGEDAIAMDKQNLLDNGSPDLYYIAHGDHNLYFLTSVDSFAGRKRATEQRANELSDRLRTQVHPNDVAMEYLLPMEMNYLARFGDWEKIMAYPMFEDEHRASRVFWHLNRARALVAYNKHNAHGSMRPALQELQAAQSIVDEDDQEVSNNNNTAPRVNDPEYIFQNNPVLDLINIYRRVVEGELHEANGDVDAAVANLTAALEVYDNLKYDEPPPFFYPVRETLGGIYLRAGKPDLAEEVFREDLVMYPGNGRSLFGLYSALQAQGVPYDDELAQFESAWQWADRPLSISTL